MKAVNMKSIEIYNRAKALYDSDIDLEKFTSDTGDAILGKYLTDAASGDLGKVIESYNAALRLIETFPKNPRPELIPLFVSLKDKRCENCLASLYGYD
jgi:hypothetical protein